MKIQEYRKKTTKELKEMSSDLRKRIMASYSFLEKPKEKPENRKRLKREIAKINTVINERRELCKNCGKPKSLHYGRSYNLCNKFEPIKSK